MKDTMIILLASFVFTSFVLWDRANANESNMVLKQCLDDNGYKPENFETFDFNKAAACWHGYAVKRDQAELQRLREFVKNKPWYKGKNWNWELRSEYTCTKRYDLNGIEVCSKPYYLN
jgi:hypothetical protein